MSIPSRDDRQTEKGFRPTDTGSVQRATQGLQAEYTEQLHGARLTPSGAGGGERSYPKSLEMTPIPGYDKQGGQSANGHPGEMKQAGVLDWLRGIRQKWLYPDIGDGGRWGFDHGTGEPVYHAPGFDPIDVAQG